MQRTFKSKNGGGNRRQRPRVANVLSGGKFIPSDEPPVINGQPWNTIIVDTDLDVTTGTWVNFPSNVLFSGLQNQAGFSANKTVQFEVRYISISVWFSSDTASRFSMLPLNPIELNGVELARIESNTVKNKYAKVGYHYPLAVSSRPLSLDNKADVYLFSVQASAAGTALIHFKLLWRGSVAGFKTRSAVRARYVAYENPNKRVLPIGDKEEDDADFCESSDLENV